MSDPVNSDDADLRASIRALRSSDAPTTPSFEAIVARAPVRAAPRWRLPAAVAATVLALLVGRLWFAAPPDAVEATQLELPAWPQATSSLLAIAWTSPAPSAARSPSDAFRHIPSLPAQEQK